MRRSTTIVIAATLTLGACGSTTHKRRADTGCRPAVSRALRMAPTATTPGPPQYGITTCTYRLARGARVTVIKDTGPQAFKRFDRQEVETFQNSQWSTTPALAPLLVHHIGEGADWIPFYHQLIASDGRALFTITVKGDDAHARDVAIATARATLRSGSAG